MPANPQFLQAIADDPDNDLPRLIYADWLAEHVSEERGELVRVQWELQTMEKEHNTAKKHYARLQERETELLNTLYPTLVENLRAAFEGIKGCHVGGIIRGGVLEGVIVYPDDSSRAHFDMKDFLRRLSDLMDANKGGEVTIRELSFGPWTNAFRLTDDMLQEMAQCEALKPITKMTLLNQSDITYAGINHLTAPESSLRGLQELNIGGNFLSFHQRRDGQPTPISPARGAKAISQFPELRKLDVSRSAMPRAALEALADKDSKLHHLEELRIYNTDVLTRQNDLQGMEALVANGAPMRESLKTLHIAGASYNRNRNESYCDFLPDIPNLETLSFHFGRFNETDLNAIAKCRNLRHLDLKDMTVFVNDDERDDPKGLATLFASESQLGNLETLYLEPGKVFSEYDYFHSGITPQALGAMSAPDCPLNHLRDLSIINFFLGESEYATPMQNFMQSDLAGRLSFLDLSNNNLSQTALKALAERTTPARLEELHYGHNYYLSPEALKPLISSAALPKLHYLAFSDRYRQTAAENLVTALAEQREHILSGSETKGGLPSLTELRINGELGKDNTEIINYTSEPFDPKDVAKELKINWPDNDSIQKKLAELNPEPEPEPETAVTPKKLYRYADDIKLT